jgi:hypothetical protein
MAIFTPGPAIGAISGNLGGVNFVVGKHFPYIRTRALKTDKNTQDQLYRRARVQQVSQYWSNIDEDKRLAWNTAAQTLSLKNRVGATRGMSGHQLFLWMNMSSLLAISVFEDPPPNLWAIPAAQEVELTASASGSIEVDFFIPFPAPSAFVHYYGARTVSTKPRSHFGFWNHLVNTHEIWGPNSTDITTHFQSKLGNVIEGEVIGVKLRLSDERYLPSFETQAQTTVIV